MTEIALGNLTPRRIGGFNPETGEFDQTQGGLTRDVGNRHVLKSYEYHPVDRLLTSRTYANDHTVHYDYDFLRRVTSTRHGDEAIFRYTYTGEGNLHSIRDYALVDAGGTQTEDLQRFHEFNYDALGRLVSFTDRAGDELGSILQHGTFQYDDAGRLWRTAYNIPSISPNPRRTTSIFAQATGNLVDLWLPTGNHWRLHYQYDHLQRLNHRWLLGGTNWHTEYTYRTRSGDDSAMQVETLTYHIEDQRNMLGMVDLPFQYTYDNIGQITQ